MKNNLAIIFALFVFLALPAAAQPPVQITPGGFEVNGRIVNALTGAVLRKAVVQLIPTTQRTQVQRFDVGSDGAFEFHNIAPGKYSLAGQARGFPPQLFEEHQQFNTAIVVGPGKVSTGVVFRMQPEGSISGRILDEHNEPVRDAQVLLFERRTDSGRRLVEPRSQAQSDYQGEYRFGHLSPGSYYLATAAQPWYRRYLQGVSRKIGPGQFKPEIDPALDTAYPVTYYPGATDADSAGAIALHSGDDITADFDLAPVQSLHLTIRNNNPDGTHPIFPNFQQRIFGTPAGAVQPTVVSGPEEIEVSGIAPGDYEVGLVRANQKEQVVRNQELNLQGDTELDASSGAALAEIHAQIKFDGARVPRNPFVQLSDGSGNPMASRVDEHGELTIQPLHPGRYAVALFNAPGYAIRSISATGAKVSGRTLEVTGAQPAEVVIDASDGVATVNGTVMNRDKPASGAMVVLVPREIADNVTLFRRDQSDSDGTFTLSDVVPGQYTAIAIQNGWDMEWATPEALRPYLAKGTVVKVNGKQQLDIKITSQ